MKLLGEDRDDLVAAIRVYSSEARRSGVRTTHADEAP